MLKIAVVDSDIRTERLLKALLEGDYEVHCRFTASGGLGKITMLNPDIIIIDPLYPKRDGADFIRAVREWSDCPVIAVSENTTERAAVDALEAGADDYVRKPFYPAELKSRVGICARRIKTEFDGTQTVYRRNGLHIDLEARRVTLNGEEVHLTKTEFKILSLLCRNCGKVLTHEFIIKSVWGQNADGDTGTLRVNITKLRRKLKYDREKNNFLRTESGVGYFMPESRP